MAKTIKLDAKHTFQPLPFVAPINWETDTHLSITPKWSIGGKEIILTKQPDGSFINENRVEYVKVAVDRRPKPYSISSREEGRGPKTTTKFATLKEIQEYVKGRWQGPEYIDGESSFHGDYATFELQGCTLSDLGKRTGDGYDWTWSTL